MKRNYDELCRNGNEYKVMGGQEIIMPIYNKLVRDRIPEIIEKSGKSYRTRILNATEFLNELNKKLEEELAEYLATDTASNALEELADMMEILYALAEAHDSSPEELEQIREEKASVRGGFSKRIYLLDVDDA